MATEIDEKDLAKFKKLGIRNLIELSLILPNSYEDRNIYTDAKLGIEQVLHVEIKNFSYSPKVVKLRLFCFNLNQEIDAVIFRPRPYHSAQFMVGMEVFVYGKVEMNFNNLQMVQPRIITKTGGIEAVYKTPLRADVMKNLIKKFLHVENLVNEGLPQEISQEIIEMHFSTCRIEDKLHALKFAEMYNHLKILKSKKESYPALKSFDEDYETWTKSLPFELTQDQLRAIGKIQKDFTKDKSAKRMVVGDVGSGKTMVILASAYMAREFGSVLMAPTTVLVNQLFEEAKKFLPSSMDIKLLTNKTSKKEDFSTCSFIIGTHAVLYRELNSPALVMIDEQHRFGTAQRNKLTKLMKDSEKRPHFLQFSATPIPRTQAMINSSLLDVSLIQQTPFKKDIDNMVIHKQDFPELLEHIKNEIDLEHQVLIVYPLVEQSEFIDYQSIQEARAFWENKFDNVYVTHGKDKEKEQVLYDFREKGDILLATTVVEVGISLPELTTVVIVGAERLGLSTLHQLRGRVSRTGLKGYCYLYTNTQKSPRLESFASTPSGFDIARLDLAYRKSGDLLSGSEQSGMSFKFIDMANDETIISEVQKLL